MLLGSSDLSDDNSIKRRRYQNQVIKELKERPAAEFIADLYKQRLSDQLRVEGVLSEAEIGSHIIDRCEKMKNLEIEEKLKEFGMDVEEKPEIVIERMRDRLIEQAKRLNEVA